MRFTLLTWSARRTTKLLGGSNSPAYLKAALDALLHGVAQNTPPQFQAQAIQTLNQIFDAVKQALSVSVVQGFLVVLFICGAVFLTTLFFKDVPMTSTQEVTPDSPAEDKTEEAPVAAS